MTEQRLYRGKPVDKKRGEWVYGYLTSKYSESSKYTTVGLYIEWFEDEWLHSVEVHPKTVGRAIKLKDKSDVEIYINDIYLYYQPLSKNGRQIHKEHRIVVQDDIVELFFLHNRAEGCHGGVKVIGNTHDDNNLLENK